jgi:hypothetical protein
LSDFAYTKFENIGSSTDNYSGKGNFIHPSLETFFVVTTLTSIRSTWNYDN